MRDSWLLLALGLVLGACVDAGRATESTTEDVVLSFLLEIDGESLRTVRGPSVGSSAGGPSAWTADFSPGLEHFLLEFTQADLQRASPLIDLERLSDTQVVAPASEVCGRRYDAAYETVLAELPRDLRTLALASDGTLTPRALSPSLQSKLRLRAPMAERPCEPPVKVLPFAEDGVVFEDGFLFGGQPEYFGIGDRSEELLRVLDAQFLSSGEVVALNEYALFILERGRRLRSDQDPGYFHNRPPLFPWTTDKGQGPLRSLTVLPSELGSEGARIVAVSSRPVGEEPGGHLRFESMIVSLDYASGSLSVASSTVVIGAPSRILLDHERRAIVAIDAADGQGRGTTRIVWTMDGLEYASTSVAGAVKELRAGPDATRPHLIVTRDPNGLFLGDVTRPAETWTTIQLPSLLFAEGLRSVAGFLEAGMFSLVLGTESERLFLQPPGGDFVSLETALAPSTYATSCRGTVDECGSALLPEEADWVTVIERPGQSRWFLILPRRCPAPMAVRQDGCATHLPIGLQVPMIAQRSFHSLRYSASEGRGLLSGSEGRLLELVLDP